MKLTLLQMPAYPFEEFSKALFNQSICFLGVWLMFLLFNIFLYKFCTKSYKKAIFIYNLIVGLPILIYSIYCILNPEKIAPSYTSEFTGSIMKFSFHTENLFWLAIYVFFACGGLSAYTKRTIIEVGDAVVVKKNSKVGHITEIRGPYYIVDDLALTSGEFDVLPKAGSGKIQKVTFKTQAL